MSNQVILWSMLIIPWLSLLFLKREVIRRYMPAALFVALSTILIIDMGVGLKWWTINENIYPLNEVLPYSIGFFLVVNIWILKYTYGRFWLYTVTQLLLGFVFILLIQPWLSQRGIWIRLNATNFLAFLPVIPHFISVYLYQMWQEGEPIFVIRRFHSAVAAPAANKPFFKDNDTKKDDN